MQTPNRILYDPDQVFPAWTTTEPVRWSRIVIMPFLAVSLALLVLVCQESYYLYHDFRQADLAVQTDGAAWSRNTRPWMNAQDLSRFYKVPIENVFSALEIVPEPGDEKMNLRELAEKYQKTPAQVWEALNYLNNLQPRRGKGP